jgi:cytochrome c oxidase subunit 2
MHWWFPSNASSVGGQVDTLFYAILYVTAAVFLLTEAALLIFIIRYRRRDGRSATYVEGSTKAEIIWTAIPAVTVVSLALFSQPVWSKIKNADAYPPNADRLAVEAKQFEWHVTYPGPDGKLGTDDDFMKRDELHLVANHDYVIELTARDVVHSFFIPAFRIKQDAVPGMHILVWVKPTVTGSYELACAELCGLGHYRMRAQVVVQTPDEFAAWLRSQGVAVQAPSDTMTTGKGTR